MDTTTPMQLQLLELFMFMYGEQKQHTYLSGPGLDQGPRCQFWREHRERAQTCSSMFGQELSPVSLARRRSSLVENGRESYCQDPPKPTKLRKVPVWQGDLFMVQLEVPLPPSCLLLLVKIIHLTPTFYGSYGRSFTPLFYIKYISDLTYLCSS